MLRTRFSLVLLTTNIIFGIGTSFLNIPSTARELALGANPVIAITPTANPALLAIPARKGGRLGNVGPELSLSYGAWLAGVKRATIGTSSGLGPGIGALRIRYAGLDDLELRKDQPVDIPLSHFGAHGVSFDGTFAWKVGATHYGVTLRITNIRLYTASSNGYAVDLGMVHRIHQKTVLGLAVLNIGTMSPLDQESPAMPLRLIGGAAYKFVTVPMTNVITFSMEWSTQIQQLILRIGNEVHWNALTLQLSTQFSEQVATVSGGFGLQIGLYRLQYGVQIGSQNLGIPQMIDVSVRLP